MHLCYGCFKKVLWMTDFINIDPDFSISEVVLEESNKQGFIKELIINEFAGGFFITAKLAWSGQKVWTLTTRREKDKARIFKDLTRLNDFLKEKIYTEEVKIIRIK